MEVLMSEYQIENIVDGALNEWDNQKCLLWVWHADKIPPHLGISIEGKYFSLKANGKDQGLAIDTILSVLNKKQIKTVCFEIDTTITLQDLESEFLKFTTTIPNEISCLEPIQNLLQIKAASQLNDLLIALDERNQIKKTIGFNVTKEFKNFKRYTIEDVHARLKLLAKNKD